VDRIEVLKGPQGTLYGRNATGGAINLLPVAPQLGKTSGNLSAAVGNYDTVQVNGAVNVPIGEMMALRAAAFYAKHDGYLSDGADDQDDHGARLSLLVTPSDDLRITVVGDYSRIGGTGGGTVIPAMGASNRYGLNSPQTQAFYQSQPNLIAGRNFGPMNSSVLGQDNRQFGISANIEWTNPLGTLTILPAYRNSHNDFVSDAPGFYLAADQRFKQTSIEARLASDGSTRLGYIVGAFYIRETGEDEQYVNAQSQATPQTYSTTTQSEAVFGDVSYAVTPAFKINLGGRYTHDDKRFNGTYQSVTKLCLGVVRPPFTGRCPAYTFIPYGIVPSLFYPPGAGSAVPVVNPAQGTLTTGSILRVNREQSYREFTYKVGASWQVTDQNLLYGNYSTGYKSGGFFFSNDAGTYLPESIKAWSLGSKNRFLDGKLQLNLEYFHYDYENMQISHPTSDSTGATIFATENVGQAIFQGVELDVQYRPFTNTRLSFDVQYLEAEYKKFLYTAPASLVPTTTCRQSIVSAALASVDCSGKRPINSPTWTIGASAEQIMPLSSGDRFVLGGRIHYQSRTATGLEFTPIEYQGAYTLADLYLRFETRDDRFSIEGFVNNVTDETVITNSTIVVFSTFNRSPVKPPRVFGARVGYKF
jgi:iron complex outermembrane recepter protein